MVQPMAAKKNGKGKVKVTFGPNGAVHIKGVPGKKHPEARAAAQQEVIEQLLERDAQRNLAIKGLREDLDGIERRLSAEKDRAEQAIESNRQLEERLRKLGNVADLQEQVRNLELGFKDNLHQLYGLRRMLDCIDFLSRYFGDIKMTGFQHTEVFGTLVNLEAGGLMFEMTQPKSDEFGLWVCSAEDTTIKLAYTRMPLEDNGQIGPDALGMIKLRQEAITPEGRSKLLKLDKSTFETLYKSARRQRRGSRVANAQSAPSESQHCSNPDKGRLSEDNPHMSDAAAATLGQIRTSNVTPLRRRLDPEIPTRHNRERGSVDTNVSGEGDAYSVMKTAPQIFPLLMLLPKEFKLRDYRDEIPNGQQ